MATGIHLAISHEISIITERTTLILQNRFVISALFCTFAKEIIICHDINYCIHLIVVLLSHSHREYYQHQQGCYGHLRRYGGMGVIHLLRYQFRYEPTPR